MKTRMYIKGLLVVGVLSLCCLPNKNVNSQLAVSDPSSVANAATSFQMLTVFRNVYTTIRDSKKQADSLIANYEFLQNIKETGIEVKRLYFLLESIVCATDEFDMYIGYTGDIEACNKRLRIDVTISRLDGIPRQLKQLLSGVLKMSKSESKEKLKELNDGLEKSTEELLVINEGLKKDLENDLSAKIENLPFSVRYPIIWEHYRGQPNNDLYTHK